MLALPRICPYVKEKMFQDLPLPFSLTGRQNSAIFISNGFAKDG